MAARDFAKRKAALMKDVQKADNDYKKGMAHLDLARLNYTHKDIQSALNHYITAARYLRRVNEVHAATLYEECVNLCFETDNLQLGTDCLRSAFECFQIIGWEDRCDSILERIVSIGRTDIADELSRYSAKHKFEILLIQLKDVKGQIKRKKLVVPDVIDANLANIEAVRKEGDYNKCVKLAQDAKSAGEGLLKDQKEALEKMRVADGELKELSLGPAPEIAEAMRIAKDAIGKGDFRAASNLADKALKDAKAMVAKREEEKRQEEEKKREEERKHRELEENIRREEEKRKREEEKRFKFMSELDKMVTEPDTESQKPRLFIEYTKNKEYRIKEYGEFVIEVRNEGGVDIKNIEVDIESDCLTSRAKTLESLSRGESHEFKMSIRPSALGNSVPLDVVVKCEDPEGKKYSIHENTDGIKVVDKVLDKKPETIEYHIHSGGDVALGGQILKDSVQMRSGFQPGENLPGLAAPKEAIDSTERYSIYKDALKKWYVNQVDDDYMDRLKAKLNISLREHENLEVEVQKEKESDAGDSVLF